MFLSIFDIFKVGIGPSSSHTMGPMVAAGRFLDALRSGMEAIPGAGAPARLGCTLHGSLAFTGKGHATDRAVTLGLGGFSPDSFDAEKAGEAEAAIRKSGEVRPSGLPPMAFDPGEDLKFEYGPALPGHANGMILSAYDDRGALYMKETYYSVGGGFVVTEKELAAEAANADPPDVPYPFRTALEMLHMTAAEDISIAEMKRRNELSQISPLALKTGVAKIWQVMNDCMDRGLSRHGDLPGGLPIRRRAKAIHEKLLAEHGRNLTAPHVINDWIAVYAMAVNEENAAGGQVVTAPTNGASGVVPAAIRYYLDPVPGARREKVEEFLLTAAALGAVIKHNASISG
ncbi:MAG: L-serine ammonia-lyase, partial [Paracoccaceae bacterium]